jgi:menaquinone-9 beta-reductase
VRRAQPPLILGGGPAGAAAAIHLARAGYAPKLIERSTGPHHKVCGDFITAEAMHELQELGIDCTPAVPLSLFRLIHGHGSVEASLPFRAFGLTRRTLDEALLNAAAVAGAELRRGETIHGLRRASRGFEVAANNTTMTSETIFLATGKHDIRGAARSGRSRLIGRKTYLQLAPHQAAALASTVELILLRRGYAGLQPVEGNRAVLCTLTSPFTRGRIEPRSGSIREGGLIQFAKQNPHLATRLAGATLLLPRPIAITGMPYGRMQPNRDDLFRLGDQAAAIPSFTGAGVALALRSARLAAATWISGADAAAYARRLHTVIGPPMRCASLLHALLLSPTLQPFAAAVARLCPAVLPLLARRTRLH